MPGPGLFSRILARLTSRPVPRTAARARPAPAGPSTVEVPIRAVEGLTITYRPQRNGAPDAGEVAWAWVPYQEDPTQGKDRPVLIIGRVDSERVYAVKLTSRSHDGERDYLHLGSGPWDSRGRQSWVDIDQVYAVPTHGIRREAAALDRTRYARVAEVLHRRYGWAVEI